MANKKTNWIIIIIAIVIVILIFVAIIYKVDQKPKLPSDLTSEEFLKNLTAPDDPNFEIDQSIINDLTPQ
jgi:uncharacterized protein YpmB